MPRLLYGHVSVSQGGVYDSDCGKQETVFRLLSYTRFQKLPGLRITGFCICCVAGESLNFSKAEQCRAAL